MIAALEVLVDGAVDDHAQVLAVDDHVVEAPTSVILPHVRAASSPETESLLFWIEMSKGVHEAFVEEGLKGVTLLIGKASATSLANWIINVNLMMSYIEVACYDDWLLPFCLQVAQVILEVDVPLIHPIVESLQAVTRVGHIDSDHYKVLVLCSYGPPLLVMLRDPQVISYVQGRYLTEDGSPRIAFSGFTAIPILVILPGYVVRNPYLIQFLFVYLSFIEADNIWVRLVKEFL